MNKIFTLFAIFLLWCNSASAYPGAGTTLLEPVRMSVTSPTPNTSPGAQLTVNLLKSDGSDFSPASVVDLGASVTTDAGGVLSFLLDGSGWGYPDDQPYSPNYLVRVTYGGVVLSIERLEDVYSKQGLYGAYIDPNAINTNVTYNFKEVDVQNPPGLAKIGLKLPEPFSIIQNPVIFVDDASGSQTFGVGLNGDFESAGSGIIGNELTVNNNTTLKGKLNLSYGTAANLTALAASTATVIYYTGSDNINSSDIRVGTNGEVLYIAYGGPLGSIVVLGTVLPLGNMLELIWVGDVNGVGGTWFVMP